MTIILKNHPKNKKKILSITKDVLCNGGLIAIPTETFYALAVDANNSKALNKLQKLKNRSPNKPLPLIASNINIVKSWMKIPHILEKLIEVFWPGPLTLVLKPYRKFLSPLLAKNGTLGIRISPIPIVKEIAQIAQGFITSTSANYKGEKPPSEVSEIHPEIIKSLGIIIDSDRTKGYLPSTIIGIENNLVVVFRKGAISINSIRDVIGYLPLCK